MNIINKYNECWTDGMRAENEFVNILKSKNIQYIHASKEEDMKEHWDLKIFSNNKTSTVDIKALRKFNRNDSNYELDWILIELSGVKYHPKMKNDGWLNGKAEYIVFERPQSFIMVNREDLKTLTYSLVNTKVFANSSKEAKYIVYSRPNRHDLFTWIEIDQLSKIKRYEWKKV